MKKTICRVCAVLLSILILLSLCACGVDSTATTTTVGEVTTTAVDDTATTTVGEVTTTVAGDTTATTVGEVTTTVADDTTATSVGEVTATVTGSDTATTTVAGSTVKNPFLNLTRPVRTTVTTTTTTESAVTTTKPNYTNTLAKVERDPKYQNKAGINNLFKYYCWGAVFKPSELLPLFGYVKDDKIVDVMFEGCAVQPSPSNVYYGDLDTKESWDAWREHSYKNMDSINEAAATVQESLELKEYKVKVFLSLFIPLDDVTGPGRFGNWGSLNGTAMTAADDEERFQMVKYMIDAYIAEMSTKEYANVEFVGFYWFDEFVKEAKLDWYNRVNDYIHSKGLFTMISPYYKATGWDLWDEAGFDLSSMQTNFYPSWKVGDLNTGTIRRIEGLTEAINNGEIGGAEIEITTTSIKDDITGFKHVMKGCAESGAMNGYQLFYFGPRPLYTLSRSRDPYFRSAYDDMYKYIHNKLVPSEMEIHEFENEQEFAEGAVDWI